MNKHQVPHIVNSSFLGASAVSETTSFGKEILVGEYLSLFRLAISKKKEKFTTVEIQEEVSEIFNNSLAKKGNKAEPEAEPQNSETSGSGVFTRHNDEGGSSHNGKEVQR